MNFFRGSAPPSRAGLDSRHCTSYKYICTEGRYINTCQQLTPSSMKITREKYNKLSKLFLTRYQNVNAWHWFCWKYKISMRILWTKPRSCSWQPTVLWTNPKKIKALFATLFFFSWRKDLLTGDVIFHQTLLWFPPPAAWLSPLLFSRSFSIVLKISPSWLPSKSNYSKQSLILLLLSFKHNSKFEERSLCLWPFDLR